MPADLELCYLSATDARDRFEAGTLSPVELVQALIDRAEAVEPKINAFTHTFHARALKQAREAENRFRGRGARPRALEGLPVAIKDLHDVKGEITTFGSRLFADNRSTSSLPYVERLLRAGAILFARTTSPEFGCLGVTHSELWGVTRNPWNLAFGPGGSSGGAGAALAAGTTTLADGSDSGGSIRIPASCCGVFGIKPAHGRVPIAGPGNLDQYLAHGPMTRSVADSALMMNVMAGPHRRDSTSVPGRLRLPLKPAGIEGWRIACSPDLGYFDVDPEVAANTGAAAATFRDLGASVEEVSIPWTNRVLDAGIAHWVAFMHQDPQRMPPERRALLSPATRDYADHNRARQRLSLEEAERVRAGMYADLEAVFRRHRVLICPATGLPSVPADLPIAGAEVTINGRPQDPLWDWTLTYPFNVLGHLPTASVPTGFSSSGVPTGLQIVGRPYDETSVFRVAAAFERAQPWLDSQEHRPRL